MMLSFIWAPFLAWFAYLQRLKFITPVVFFHMGLFPTQLQTIAVLASIRTRSLSSAGSALSLFPRLSAR